MATEPGLFNTLYVDCQGFINLRAIKEGKTKQEFFQLDDTRGIKSFIHVNRDRDLYFGVATRDGRAGKKENIIHIPALWVDIDFKSGDPATLEQALASFPLPPTIKVLSGGGMHSYWSLKEPADREDIEQCESIMRGLAMALNGDITSTDAARILRVPNTRNYKYKPPRPVVLAHCNGSRYNLSDFDDFTQLPESKPPLRELRNATLDAIMSCDFMCHCRDDAATLREPEWYAMLTQLAREIGGPALIHKLSKPHPKYKKSQTDSKIIHAINDTGPITCERIKMLWNCTKDCDVRSPAALSFLLSHENDLDVSCVSSVSNSEISEREQHLSAPPDHHANNANNLNNANSAISVPLCEQREHVRTVCEQIANRRDLLAEVQNWIELSSGRFNIRDIYSDLGLKGREQTVACAKILHRLKMEGVIESQGNVRGNYAIVERIVEKIDFLARAHVRPYNILLPFNLNSLVEVQEKNIIIIAGNSNAGKTAFLLNILYLNLCAREGSASEEPLPPIKWFSSEMSSAEWARRLNRTGMPLEWWASGFELYQRSANFHQVIDPNATNIIDYLEIHKDFFAVGELIKEVFDRLRNGIAIIALQKNTGSELGLGGGRSIEKARLYLTFRHNPPYGQVCKIMKLKNRLTQEDYNYRELTFTIENGFECRATGSWSYPRGANQ